MKWLQLILNAFLKYQQGRSLMPKNTESLIGLLISILVIIIAVANGIAIGYALIVVWCIMAYVFYRKGYQPKELLNLSWTGAKSSIVVMQMIPAHRLAHCYVASSRHHPYRLSPPAST